VAPRLLWQQVHDVLNDIRSAAPAVDDRLPSELEMAGAQGPIGFASCSRTTRRWCGRSWPHGLMARRHLISPSCNSPVGVSPAAAATAADASWRG
jgi:hypothetical protein